MMDSHPTPNTQHPIPNTQHPIKRFTDTEYAVIVQDLISKRIIHPETKSLYIYTKDILINRLNHLKNIFPEGSLHAVAIKSNSEHPVIEEIVRNGCGLEAASFEEVLKAKAAGCANEDIVFDSPVKTVTEIEDCNNQFPGITLNANCFAELDRLKGKNNIRVGIRINPLMDLANPGMYDVSGTNSKFGIPIDQKEKIIQYALDMDNCSGLHIHAGSEIGSMENHAAAIASIVKVAEEISGRGKKLDFIDVGGGVSANMKDGEQEGLEVFYSGIMELAPELANYRILTEYGRFVHAHCAFVISKVEYLLDHTTPPIALIHVGADLFLREIYSSHPPHHGILVFDKIGNLKTAHPQQYDVGGPLCFSGDFLQRGVRLPEIEPGDYLCIKDTGSNTLSMWSRHCSREEIELVMM